MASFVLSQSPESLGPQLDAAVYTAYSTAMVVIALKMACRRKLGMGFWWDDYLAMAGAVPATASLCVYVLLLRGLLGRHIAVLGFQAYTPFLKGFFTIELLYVIDVSFIKFSICLFYWRMFHVSARIPLLIVMTSVVMWFVGSIFAIVFQCQPINFFWNKLSGTGVCLNPDTLFEGVSIADIVTNAAIAFLPLPYIWRMNMALEQRLRVGSVFCVGSFVIAVSITRLVLLLQIDPNDPDITWNLSGVTVWSIIEICAGVVCGCMPSLRPVVKWAYEGFSIPISWLCMSYKGRGGGRLGRQTPEGMTGKSSGWTGSTGRAGDTDPDASKHISTTTTIVLPNARPSTRVDPSGENEMMYSRSRNSLFEKEIAVGRGSRGASFSQPFSPIHYSNSEIAFPSATSPRITDVGTDLAAIDLEACYANTSQYASQHDEEDQRSYYEERQKRGSQKEPSSFPFPRVFNPNTGSLRRKPVPPTRHSSYGMRSGNETSASRKQREPAATSQATVAAQKIPTRASKAQAKGESARLAAEGNPNAINVTSRWSVRTEDRKFIEDAAAAGSSWLELTRDDSS